MRTLEISQATAPLSDYAREIGNEPLILTIDGKPYAVLVPLENTDIETAALSTDPRFLALIERSRARQKEEGGISGEEMRRRLGI
jgi:antitoxin (DNA-binding transcriptional repressor) of toxin-antitoxin stability system